jgi:hypothetical protein
VVAMVRGPFLLVKAETEIEAEAEIRPRFSGY